MIRQAYGRIGPGVQLSAAVAVAVLLAPNHVAAPGAEEFRRNCPPLFPAPMQVDMMRAGRSPRGARGAKSAA